MFFIQLFKFINVDEGYAIIHPIYYNTFSAYLFIGYFYEDKLQNKIIPAVFKNENIIKFWRREWDSNPRYL